MDFSNALDSRWARAADSLPRQKYKLQPGPTRLCFLSRGKVRAAYKRYERLPHFERFRRWTDVDDHPVANGGRVGLAARIGRRDEWGCSGISQGTAADERCSLAQ